MKDTRTKYELILALGKQSRELQALRAENSAQRFENWVLRRFAPQASIERILAAPAKS